MALGIVIGVLFLVGAMAAPLSAQDYPNKPIRFILPFPPGGATDILGRIVSQRLSERLGQPFVPENQPGAGGIVGTANVTKSRPDGYIIGLASGGAISVHMSAQKRYYDSAKDLAPISQVGAVRNVVIINPNLPVKNLKELIEYAKANPGKLNFSSGGLAAPPHLGVVMLNNLAKVNMVYVPYKGANQAMMAMMANEIDLVVIPSTSALPQIQAGKVRGIVVLSEERLAAMPELPTAKELGYDVEASSWFGIFAPAGTPPEIVIRLSAEWAAAAALPETRQMMQKAGFDTLSNTPEKFAEFIRKDTAQWSKVIRENNIRIE
jgi:tripartite-type tricarboxylate transporter receptor subunit TctC